MKTINAADVRKLAKNSLAYAMLLEDDDLERGYFYSCGRTYAKTLVAGVIKLTHKRILSPTAINTYLSCPRKFYLRYIKKLKTKPSIYLVRGSVVHKVLELFAREHKSPKGHDAAVALIKLFDQEWRKAKYPIQELKMTPKALDGYVRKSRAMLLNFFFWLRRSNLWPPTRSEMRMVSKKLGLMGIIDALYRLPEGPLVVDYKTSKKGPDHTRSESDRPRLYRAFVPGLL